MPFVQHRIIELTEEEGSIPMQMTRSHASEFRSVHKLSLPTLDARPFP